MNVWDVATWIASVTLAVSAIVIFVFFLRDAGSILNRELRKPDDGSAEVDTSGSATGIAGSAAPQDPSR